MSQEGKSDEEIARKICANAFILEVEKEIIKALSSKSTQISELKETIDYIKSGQGLKDAEIDIVELKAEVRMLRGVIDTYETKTDSLKECLGNLMKFGHHGILGGDICNASKHSAYVCNCGYLEVYATAQRLLK